MSGRFLSFDYELCYFIFHIENRRHSGIKHIHKVFFIQKVYKGDLEDELELKCTDQENVCLVFNNSTVHVNGETKRFFKEQEI